MIIDFYNVFASFADFATFCNVSATIPATQPDYSGNIDSIILCYHEKETVE